MNKNYKVAIHNLGCKVNSYEADAMIDDLEHHGYEIVPFSEFADIYIVNTCTVTNIAGRKSRQMLHKARKTNPRAVVIAAGCYVHTMEQGQSVDGVVDIVIGNNKKQDLIEVLQTYQKDLMSLDTDNRDVYRALVDINQTKDFESLKLSKPRNHTRVNLKVQDGCNQFCSYCIIPYVRGRVRSRSLNDVVSEVETLAKEGCHEVVLTGIHLSSYGQDLTQSEDLLALIEAIHQIKGIKRIRLGSLEPRVITEHFVDSLAKLDKFCPHFHLSLQSGSASVLKRMNRHYTPDEYLEKTKLIREYFEHPALTTDIIVGFPGETSEEFQESKDFVEGVNFYETHIFKFSKRDGTKAASMQGQVPGDISQLRSEEMINLSILKRREFEKYYIGKTVEVLIEDQVVSQGEEFYVGFTKEYIKVRVDSKDNLHNQLISVNIKNESQIVH